jgi:tetratricopeptide (TPR) repeat protein
MESNTGRGVGLAIALLAAALAAGGRAAAQDAETAYKEGVAAFEAGRYEEAAELFRAAHALRPSFKLLYNIGQSEAAAKRFGAALEAFERYLAEGGDEIAPERRDEVLAEVDRLRKMIGYVEVEAPDGAEVAIDGAARGAAPLPGPIPLASGVDHSVRVTQGERVLVERTVRVSGGQSLTVRAAAAEAPVVEAAPPEAVAAPADAGGSSGLKKGGWALVGIGGAMVVGGVVTGVLAYKKDGELYDACPREECSDTQDHRDDIDSLETLSAVTDVLLFVGGAAVATGAVLLIVDGVRGRRAERPVAVIPAAGPGFGGAAISGRF